MKRKKIFFIVATILCVIGIVGGIAAWKAYHKERPSLDEVHADVSLSANALYKNFSSNEDSSNKMYLNKVIQITGKVSAVQKDTSGVSVELFAGEDAAGGINCSMRDTADLPKEGDSVVIKGRCTGYLMDVSLVDAVKIK